MSFIHEYNKNNRNDTKHDKFEWHNKILTIRLRFICLFVNVKEMAETYKDFQSLRSLPNLPNPYATERVRGITLLFWYNFFLIQIRDKGIQTSTDEIMKYSKLFQDEITLDNLKYDQLVAMCKLINIQTLGTSNFLRFQLRMKLRNLEADDKVSFWKPYK